MEALRTIYRYWAAVVFLAVLAQISAGAFGAFYSADKLGDQPGDNEKLHIINEDTFDKGFDFHTGFGYLIFLASIVLFLLALGARLGRHRIWWNLALPIIMAVQIVLAWAGEDVPFVGAFHGLNALIVFSLSGMLAQAAWRLRAPGEPVSADAARAP